MQLSDNTIPQLLNKLDLHLANIQSARIAPIPSKTSDFAFYDEGDRARYIVTEARKLNAVAQAIENMLRLAF